MKYVPVSLLNSWKFITRLTLLFEQINDFYYVIFQVHKLFCEEKRIIELYTLIISVQQNK